jgi:threonine dehydrogenase-like Zn-dependent dehydrogenase
MNCTLSVVVTNFWVAVQTMPEDVTWKEGAMTEPFACVILSILSTCFKPGESVLVLGAGFMSMLHVMLAKSWGAGYSIPWEKYAEVLKTIEDFLGEIKN